MIVYLSNNRTLNCLCLPFVAYIHATDTVVQFLAKRFTIQKKRLPLQDLEHSGNENGRVDTFRRGAHYSFSNASQRRFNTIKKRKNKIDRSTPPKKLNTNATPPKVHRKSYASCIYGLSLYCIDMFIFIMYALIACMQTVSASKPSAAEVMYCVHISYVLL